MFTQKFIKIFHSVQEIGLFSLFQNLNLGNASVNPKRHLSISWATSCQHQCVCKIWSKYPKWLKSYRRFFTNRPASKSLFFRIWTSATPQPTPYDIWQALGLHLVNINAYVKFYQNVPNGLRVIDIFHEQAGVKIFTNCYRALLEIQLSVDFLRVVQSKLAVKSISLKLTTNYKSES